MRFRQLQKKSNVVLKKKMYKSGKNWVVKSSLAIISGLTLFGVSQTINVKADTVPVGQENTANDIKTDTVPTGQVDSDETLTDDSATENASKSPELPTNSGGQSTVSSGNPKNLPVNPVQEKQPTVTLRGNIEENYQKSDINDSQSDADQEEQSANFIDVSKKALTNVAISPVQIQSDDTVPKLDPEQSGDFGVHWYTDKGTLHLGRGTMASVTYDPAPFDPWSENSESSDKLRESITKIVFDGPVKAGDNLDSVFSHFSNLTEIDNLTYLDTSDTRLFIDMFLGDVKLEKIDLSKFNTRSAISLSGLFEGDKALTSIDVSGSGFDVSNVTDFSNTFGKCNGLKDINISNWNMARATDFERMFDADELMESVELPDSVTSTKVKSDSKMNFDDMFDYCIALKSLDLSNLNMNFPNITAKGMLSTLANTDYANITGSLMELTLSSNNNLVSTELVTNPRDSNDGTQYASGWKVVKTADGVIPLGTEKETYLLDSMYNGVANNGTKTTWQLMFKDYVDLTVRYIAEDTSKEFTRIQENHLKQGPLVLSSLSNLGVSAEGYIKDFIPAPLQVDSSMNGQTIDVKIPVYVAPVYDPLNFNIIEKDTNDNLINETDLKIPVGKPLSDTSQVDRISSKPFILKTDNSGDKYSYVEIIDDEGKSEEPIPINYDLAGKIGYNAQDLTKFFLDNSFVNGADSSQSKWTYVIHVYYEPEKTHSGGSSSSSSGDESIPESNIENKEQTIATYADKSNVKIYDTDGNELTNRVISANTDWFSDEIMTLNNQKYYRVATDQWLKADDAYVYVAEPTLVRVYQDGFGDLIKAEGTPVTDRELKSGTDWKSDRYAYINGAKYYRVATNEFVSADQVYEYKNVNETLTTKSVVTLYNERGQKLSNELPVNTTRKIDRVVVINGQNYYRIAENEFVRTNDDIILN